jgi:preprotein translocase subunit SecY
MAEKSKLYVIKPLLKWLPAVKKAEGHVRFKTKMLWTGLIVVVYFFLCYVPIYGLGAGAVDMFAAFRTIMAGQQGSLMHLGIGPIVTASIIMQLFVGAKIINLDLSDKEDQSLYQGAQKFFAILMIIFEAIVMTWGNTLPPSEALESQFGHGGGIAMIALQIGIGAYFIMLMDEVVSKWGIGSGISLFIAGGVSVQLITGTINWLPMSAASPLSLQNPPAGLIPNLVYTFQHMNIGEIMSEFERLFLTGGGNPNTLVALIGTIAVFFIVVYVESTKVELPISHGRVRGARGKYPIKLLYASNIPVILMQAVLANVNMIAMLLWRRGTIPLIGENTYIGAFSENTAVSGLAWYVTSPRGLTSWLFPLINPSAYGHLVQYHALWSVALRVVLYSALMIGGCILFGIFWIETTNMGPRAVAKQIMDSDMQIPGFRRDPRVLERVLKRYIPPITVIGSVFVGVLAVGADLIGTVGQASGIGVLLTTGIIIGFYEQMAKEQLVEMHPVVRRFFEE